MIRSPSLSPQSFSPFRIPALVTTLVRSLPVQPKRAIHVELPDDAVARGAERDGQDDTEGNQLWWDLLEGAQALRDCVCLRRKLVWALFWVWDWVRMGSGGPGWEKGGRTGVLFLLRGS